MSKEKTIRILLKDGSLDGLITLKDSSWNPGLLFSAPREKVEKIVSSDASQFYGVYLLLSDEMVYIGQSKKLARRIQEHKLKKDWWERVIVLTTNDNSFNRSDIDYLETTMIEKAKEKGRLDSDNKQKGNEPKVDIFRKSELEQYLEEAFSLMELIGVSVFNDDTTVSGKKNKGLIPSIQSNTEKGREIRQKREAKKYLKENGIKLSNNTNYSKLQEGRGYFWINPRLSQVDNQWDIILNNQEKKTIHYLSIPANTFSVNKDGKRQLRIRPDKPEYISLKIDSSSLVDKESGCSFKDFLVKSIKY